MNTQTRAFISYSHDDQEFVRRLADALNRNGVPLFFDEWDIRPGDSIIRKIFEEGLAKSEFFFVVLSKTSVASCWVKDELDVATVRRIGGLTRVVPILRDDCEIPWSLRALRWLDMRADFNDQHGQIVECREAREFHSKRWCSLATIPVNDRQPELVDAWDRLIARLGRVGATGRRLRLRAQHHRELHFERFQSVRL